MMGVGGVTVIGGFLLLLDSLSILGGSKPSGVSLVLVLGGAGVMGVGGIVLASGSREPRVEREVPPPSASAAPLPTPQGVAIMPLGYGFAF